MRLLRVQLVDWLSYSELDLDLSEFEQLAIAGHIGAGKSALLDAVLWSLSGRGRSRGNIDRYVRDGQLSCSVTTTWLATLISELMLGPDATGNDRPVGAGEREVVIARTRDRSGRGSSTLSLWIDGQNRTRSKIEETQAAIEKLTGTTPEALLASSIMVQGHSSEFLDMEAPARKEMLFRLRDLDRYSLFYDRAHSIQLLAESDVTAAAARATTAQAVIDTELPVRSQRAGVAGEAESLEAEITSLTAERETLAERGAELREAARRRAELVRAREGAQTRLDHSLPELTDMDVDHDVYWADLAAAIPGPVGGFDRLSDLEAARQKVKTAELQTAVVDSVPCGGVGEFAACRFIVGAVAARDQLPALRRLVEELGGWDLDPAAARQEIMAAEHDRTRLLERHRTAQEWLAKEPERRRVLEERVSTDKALIAEYTAEIVRIDLGLEDATEVVTALTGLTRGIIERQERLRELDRQMGLLDGQLDSIAQAKEALGTYEGQVATFTARATTFKALARAFHRDGIPTLLLEEWLPEIETRANEILARLGGFRLQLVTQKDTKAGTTKETLDVVLTVRDFERAYEMFSGGERFQIDLALRIALGDTRGSGNKWDTLWIDEGFGSQEKDSIDALLAAVSAVAQDFGLVVVTSHIEEVTDRFPVRLVVSKGIWPGMDDETSSAEVVAA